MKRSDNRYNPESRALPPPADSFYELGAHQFRRSFSGTWYSELNGKRIKVGKEDAAKLEALRPGAVRAV